MKKLFFLLVLILSFCSLVSCDDIFRQKDGGDGNNEQLIPNLPGASEGLEFRLNPDGKSYWVSGIGTCTDTDIIIPSIYNDLPVKRIGLQAFALCSDITSVTIPNSITEIDIEAFSCSPITNVTIPNSVTTIENGAFYGCSKLTNVTFTENSKLDVIEESTFENCFNLTNINIPNSVTKIADKAFYQCTALTNVLFEENSKLTKIGKSAFYNAGLASINIPNSVTSIGASAFSSTELTSIVIPNSVTSIGNSAFSSTELTSIVIPNSVTSIGNSAFAYCKNLTSVVIPDSVTQIGNAAFKECTILTSVTLNESSKLTSIGDYAFESCKSLTNITIPRGVTSIGNNISNNSSIYVIRNYSSLHVPAKIIINNGVTIYPDNEFEYILTDDDFLFRCKNDEYELIAYCGDKATVTLPANIRGNNYSINKMRGVENVIIPDSVTSISDNAFYQCYSLKSITIPNSVTSIRTAFNYCYNLKSITIPSSVISIDNGAFFHCYNLANITVDENNVHYKSIDGNLYNKNGDILVYYAAGKKDTNFTIPNSVIKIGYSAFNFSSNLTNIIISDSVTTIDSYAFRDCDKLTSVVIGDSVTSIGFAAFCGCDNLKTVYYNGTAENWDNISIDSNISYYYPSGNSYLTKATRYYYSETEPTESGNYWHYDENGNVAVW